MESLRVDFYESGQGDTTVVTFPGGGVGVIDGYPSPTSSRPSLLEILKGKVVHFVCLTHPHEDHGADLADLVEQHPSVQSYWHTISGIRSFVYRLTEFQNFPSEMADYVRSLNKGWAKCFLKLYSAVAKRRLDYHQIRAGDSPIEIDGVRIHAIAPEEREQNRLDQFWMERAGNPKANVPDLNLLSAILVFEWGSSAILLGADAHRSNWDPAIKRYFKLALPKAVVLKVPHHGSADAMDLRTGHATYLDLCAHGNTKCHSVLFAGDAKHPDRRVYKRLRDRTAVHCLNNGMRAGTGGIDLDIQVPGARRVIMPAPCQPQISFALNKNGNVQVLKGVNCGDCSTQS